MRVGTSRYDMPSLLQSWSGEVFHRMFLRLQQRHPSPPWMPPTEHGGRGAEHSQAALPVRQVSLCWATQLGSLMSPTRLCSCQVQVLYIRVFLLPGCNEFESFLEGASSRPPYDEITWQLTSKAFPADVERHQEKSRRNPKRWFRARPSE